MRANWLDDSFAAIDRGWAVLPIASAQGKRCTCGKSHKGNENEIGKHPLFGLGVRDASADRAQVREWAKRAPVANIGIAAAQSGLLLLDVDTKHDAQYTLAELQIEHGRLPSTVTDRTQSGGTHFYFERPGFEIASGVHIAPGLEVIAHGYIVVPHSRGVQGFYTWEHSPRTTRTRQAPDWILELLPRGARNRAEAMQLPHAEILRAGKASRLVLQVLRGEVGIGAGESYATYSEAEQAALTALCAAGWAWQDCFDLFAEQMHARSTFTRKLKAHGEREARRYVRHSYENALDYIEGKREHAREVKAWAVNSTWQDRGGQYTQSVLIAHCEIAEQTGKVEYNASIREIAERAGCSKHAVENAHKKLAEAHLIERTQAHTLDAPQIATRYKLGVVSTGDIHHVLALSKPSGAQDAHNAHEAFYWHGLGKSARQVFTATQRTPATLAEIATQTGRGRATCWRALKKLAGVGLVKSEQRNTGAVWCACENVDLDKIAQVLGVAGLGEKKRKAHVIERAKWQRFCEHVQRGNGARGKK